MANTATSTSPTAADVAADGPQARVGYGVSGAGIKIGIISNSYHRDGTAGPAATVIKEGMIGDDDEGRAIAQLVNVTAPNAQLYFYSADYSENDFANGISALAAAGCQVIIDDVVYPDEPFYQVAGPISEAAANAVARGVNYFSAAGNEGSQFVEGTWRANQTVQQTVYIPAGESVTLALEWDAPYNGASPPTLRLSATGAGFGSGGATGVGSPTGGPFFGAPAPGSPVTLPGTGSSNGPRYAAAGSNAESGFQTSGEPDSLLDFPVLSVGETYTVTITQTPGTTTPTRYKDILAGGGSFTSGGAGVGSGAIFAQALVPGVNAVGAANAATSPAFGGTPAPEDFSSTGPGELLFDSNGNRLATPQTLGKPAFIAPDGAYTQVLGTFDGTSAAAAEAGAVAALVLQADPSLSNADVTTLLTDSAVPAGAASVAGAGLIRADVAVRYAATRTIFGSAQPTVTGLAQADTLAGGNGAHVLVAGSGDALIGSEGSDTVVAGAGADTVDLTGPKAVLFAGSGPLTLRAWNGSDTIVGGAAPLHIVGGNGGGVVWGSSAGGDLLTAGDQPTALVAAAADDTLMAAGGGSDTLVATGSGAATLAAGGSAGGDEFVADGSGPVAIFGGAGTDAAYLGSGAATVVGGAGALDVTGGSGPALLVGGQGGGSSLLGGGGAATIVGSAAGDTLQGGSGPALLFGAGDNEVLAAGASGAQTLVGMGMAERYVLNGATDSVFPGAGTATVGFGLGAATVFAGAGAETFTANAGATGAEAIFGFDPSRDTVQVSGGAAVRGNGAAAGGGLQTVASPVTGDAVLMLPGGGSISFIGLASLPGSAISFG